MKSVDLSKIVKFACDFLESDSYSDFEGARNGLQFANSGRVHKIAASVDAGLFEMSEAAKRGADLLLVHHGMFWDSPKPFVGPNYLKVKTLLENDIALLSMHLPLDGNRELGNNAVMAKKLGRSSVMIEIDQKYCSFGQARLNATEYEDSPVANAVFDQKPPKASMADMISAGYFTAGEQFCLKDGHAVATLLEDGKLLYNGEEMDMHSCAAKARAVKAKRLNGFDVWYVMRNDGLTPISAIRADYRSRQQQNV